MTYRPVLVSAADMAALLKRPKGTITRWASASEGRLTSYAGLYDWLEVIDVAAGRITVPPKRNPAPTTVAA